MGVDYVNLFCCRVNSDSLQFLIAENLTRIEHPNHIDRESLALDGRGTTPNQQRGRDQDHCTPHSHSTPPHSLPGHSSDTSLPQFGRSTDLKVETFDDSCSNALSMQA